MVSIGCPSRYDVRSITWSRVRFQARNKANSQIRIIMVRVAHTQARKEGKKEKTMRRIRRGEGRSQTPTLSTRKYRCRHHLSSYSSPDDTHQESQSPNRLGRFPLPSVHRRCQSLCQSKKTSAAPAMAARRMRYHCISSSSNDGRSAGSLARIVNS